MFGHGSRFKTVKWPTALYDIHGALDTLGRYPALWRGPEADPDDRGALAELVAYLIAYNVADDGTVTPQSCYRGFEEYSFGQKKRPSPFRDRPPPAGAAAVRGSPRRSRCGGCHCAHQLQGRHRHRPPTEAAAARARQAPISLASCAAFPTGNVTSDRLLAVGRRSAYSRPRAPGLPLHFWRYGRMDRSVSHARSTAVGVACSGGLARLFEFTVDRTADPG